MRNYKSTTEMYLETERELFEMGLVNRPEFMQDKKVGNNPNYETKELIGYTYALHDWKDKDKLFQISFPEGPREKCLSYAKKEFEDRISPLYLNPGESWKERKEVWEPFLEGGEFSYTYNERIGSQLGKVIEELKKQKGSRKIIVTIYDSHFDLENLGGKRRIPCSMYYQFLLREEFGVRTLSLIYNMRSCDFYSHFPIDVWLALQLLEYIGEKVNVFPARFIHFIGSLHAYKKDWNYKRIF